MIETNLLTQVNFSAFTGALPTTWNLSTFMPGGALSGTHVEVRQKVGSTFGAWGPVIGWNQTTKVATYTASAGAVEVEFRRSTPRYAPYLDPEAGSSRVSQRNLQVNADQGLFVALEWAAQYGINAYVDTLDTVGANTLGLVQQTQNHWGPGTNWSNKTWNFHLAGGYLAREHVRVKIKRPSGWQSITVDPRHFDGEDPPTGPAFFVGDFQLHLDLSAYPDIESMVIYRFTPRNVNVQVPADAVRITAANMDPSTRYSLFAAVEIGEELSKRVATCVCPPVGPPPLPPPVYFTSTLYPLLVTDSMVISAGIQSGRLIGIDVDTFALGIPTLRPGTLAASIVYLSYERWRDVNPDTFAPAIPTLTTGTLAVTIAYPSYTGWRDLAPDTVATTIPTLGSGTLSVTIAYVTYLNWRDVSPDTIALGIPTLSSGTLA